ncbi:cytochrome-c peroxidase [Methylosinus sporium]|uniref:Cytochrome-c peroxidase n=1 Tax=Methylosinus sporium TaxID=428 RepID=A0A549SPG5_METSR|nr:MULTISPECIES: cytochrome-c peroxidase [Methylosinus]MBU3890874.1 cytochrome-c peroxidase [Methylosinus sp. KRF6]TRL31519.1 cytochrome-c peroxidase [Methylosinus sporium]
MSRAFIAALSAMALIPFAAVAGDLRSDANAVFKPVTAAAAAKAVKNNELTPAKIELGKELFFDPRISSSQLISCNSCHNLSLGGVDAGSTSIGHGWQKGPRRAPTVLNAVFNVAQFWDGRSEDLKAQAKGPVQAGVEMNNTPSNVEATLNSIPAYVASFQKAFPGDNKPASFDNFAKAIEAFEATLVTPNSRLDKFLAGDEAALDATQKKGLRLFIDKGCSGCHDGVNAGGGNYAQFGAVEKPSAAILPEADKGRFAVTKSPADVFSFRVAPLRNVALRAPYFHTGQVWTLEEAVEVMAKSQLGVQLAPDETTAIVAFLGALTGDQPKVDYPVLPARTNATPKPQQELATKHAH